MKKVSFGEMRCSLARSLEIIGDWWSPLIIRDIYLGLVRFDDIALNLGISRNLLTLRLRHLVDGGALRRTAYQERPVRFDYQLTEAGEELVPIILALTAWGDRWAQPAEGQPIRFLHKTCGCTLTPKIACSACGDEVKASDVRALPGLGGAARPGTMVLAKRLAQATRA
ncbi:MAG TPA: helix-turn-helix domain-containing protein [Mesorhizobium sp.]|jgi:DNA-binding HxlR family transcriptional regulator|uniref:winged helix-turn-helix transcriptional regulator n=1 Tax=Mesorhizobium sp. TaxID=1871066 RepID=UPI002DDCB7D4|nr:helix-turn-helix domain-containing protein [Mesorhizobium sp.]HEV2503473.1 helix-turn-helix domain-containing protein [Mesorhizobium sp.]